MLVRECMTKKVFTLSVDKKLLVAQQIMDWAHLRHIPVVDRGKRVVGIVTYHDLLRVSISTIASQVSRVERDQHLSGIPVDKVMSTNVQTISPDATVQAAAKVMREKKIGCLPVVVQGKLVGIVTASDLLRVIEELTVKG